jgi:hypothetical protein
MPRWLAVVLLAGGAALLVAAWRQSARGRETRGWTRTQARILVSEVEELGGPSEQGYPRHRLVVRYAYEARGRTHESDQLWVGSRGAMPAQDRELVRRWADRFPAGSVVDAWYDPADPRQAVLVPGAPRSQLAGLLVLGLVLAGAGLWLLARAAGR